MPPAPVCWNCRSANSEWVEHDGRGTVFTFTVTRHAALSDFVAVVPFAVGVIGLDGLDETRLVAMFVDTDPESIRVGLPVQVVWDDIEPGVSIPRVTAVRS